MKSSNGSKKTYNTKCIVCNKLLYRIPSELKKIRYAACFEHRGQAQKLVSRTSAQIDALNKIRKKGINYREGYKHTEETKKKIREATRKRFQDNPGIAKKRGEKNRGSNHYNWNGGSTRLNVSIRRLAEYYKWIEKVKERDGECVKCGSLENLESHHIVGLAVLVAKYQIKNQQDARNTLELWDLDNGITLCQKCHYEEHGREYSYDANKQVYIRKPRKIRKDFSGKNNPNWRGGNVKKSCLYCSEDFFVIPSRVLKRKYCSRRCVNDSQRKVI